MLALYDAFTINTILFLEDLGFCPKGEGGRFVSGGHIGPKGGLPVNTNGGGLSYCHPGMYGLFLLIEAVRQLRGECGARQVGRRTPRSCTAMAACCRPRQRSYWGHRHRCKPAGAVQRVFSLGEPRRSRSTEQGQRMNTWKDRLAELRGELKRQGLDGFIVPRADEHLGEYVPASAERLAWLTGFTGSAGLAAVLLDKAAIFTDGRYVLQLAAQTDPSLWEPRHITDEPAPKWLMANGFVGAKIGYDPRLISESGLKQFTDPGLGMVASDRNPIDAIWTNRPPPPLAPAVPHPLEYAGQSAEEKRELIAGLLRDAKQDAAVISDPASVAWLLNIRGSDVPFTPFALAYALAHADGRIELFMDAAKLPDATRVWLGNTVSVADPAEMVSALGRLAGRRVRVDAAGTSIWFEQVLREAGAVVVAGPDPCLLPKACKNVVEQQGTRNAHQRDAVALAQFLHFIAEAGPRGSETEMSAAAKLLALRERVTGFRGESFPAISGAGEHGAIIHYRVTADSNRSIRPDEVNLINSGAQYLRRHDRCYPHNMDRPGRSAGGSAGTRITCDERPHRYCLPGVPTRGCRRSSRRLRAPGFVADRTSTTTMARATVWGAIFQCMKDPWVYPAVPGQCRLRRE